jgi:hypothetical protein
VFSSLVRIGWEPRVLPYALLLVLAAVAFAGVYWMPEPVLERSRFRLTVQRPKVPSLVRPQFVLAGLAVLSSWSIAALFFSLGPQLALHLFRSTNVIVSGTGIVALAGSATLAQLVTARIAPWVAASIGAIALAAGMLLIVLAAASDSSVAYLAGSVVGGAGFGAAFLGGLRALVAAIPPEYRAAGPGRLLRRRLRVAVGARRPRRRARHPHLAPVDLRDLRQRRRRDRAPSRAPGLAHPTAAPPGHRDDAGTRAAAARLQLAAPPQQPDSDSRARAWSDDPVEAARAVAA